MKAAISIGPLQPTILPSKYIEFMYYICIYVFYVGLDHGKTLISDQNHKPCSYKSAAKGIAESKCSQFYDQKNQKIDSKNAILDYGRTEGVKNPVI